MAQRTAAVTNLLNNAGQGFLTFGEDLLVNEEYSSECIRVFGRRIEGIKFSELVYSDDEEGKNFFDSLMTEVFLQDDDELIVDMYLPLLPKEIEIVGKHIQFDYKIIYDVNSQARSCMAILTDVTEKRLLENQMELEKNNLKMIVKVLVNYNDFIQTLKDYRNFCSKEIHAILNSGNTLEQKVSEIFRGVHTYKGNFSQFYMMSITQKLHDFEGQISTVSKKLVSEIGNEQLAQFINKFNLDS